MLQLWEGIQAFIRSSPGGLSIKTLNNTYPNQGSRRAANIQVSVNHSSVLSSSQHPPLYTLLVAPLPDQVPHVPLSPSSSSNSSGFHSALTKRTNPSCIPSSGVLRIESKASWSTMIKNPVSAVLQMQQVTRINSLFLYYRGHSPFIEFLT